MRELSLHILDVMMNSVEAGATHIELRIEERSSDDTLAITLQDNGRGMSQEQLSRISDPFFTTRTTRHIGLGIPLFQAAAERCGGQLVITSQPGKGTQLRATFQHSHIDRAPLGDITSTVLSIILTDSCDLSYTHTVDGAEFAFSTLEIHAELGDVPFSHPSVRAWLRQFIQDGEASLQ